MPLQMSPDLQFATGAMTPLNDEAVEEFLTYVRKISVSAGRKHVLEEFKRAFCRVAGEPYYSSSSEGWADSDLSTAANKAATHAPGFIQAFVEACEALQTQGASVPSTSHLNQVLDRHQVPFRIESGVLIVAASFVAPPDEPQDAASVASRAFSEAAGLVRHGQAPSAVDRIHTALHAYLLEICSDAGIGVGDDPTTAFILKTLKESHPAFQPTGPRHDDVTRILRSLATVVDSMSPIRNKASLAHVNPLLEAPEAIAVVNAAYIVFRYVQDSLARHRGAPIY